MRRLLSGLCLSLALASAAVAQSAPSRLTQLHDDLRLTARRRAPGATTRPPSPPTRRRRPAAASPSDAATADHARRIALIDAAMDQDLADFHRQGDATLAFYGRLTPAQQQVFDRETAGPGGASPSGH